jgi:phospholipid transport system substrate-binding protein
VKTFLKVNGSFRVLSVVSAIAMLASTGTSIANQSVSNGGNLSAQMVSAEVGKIAQDDPYVMVEQAASKTFARIKIEQYKIKQDPENLRTIMEEELMPYIDHRFSAFKVLGKYARQVNKKELLEFVSVFREYLITTYAVAMGYYDDQEVEFDPARDYGDRGDVTVRAVIKDDNRPDIKVAFKVRKDPRSGDWQAYDMIAEGISLLSSKQTEFESILRRDGINKVIELMRASIREPILLNGDDTTETASITSNEKSE